MYKIKFKHGIQAVAGAIHLGINLKIDLKGRLIGKYGKGGSIVYDFYKARI